MIEGDFRRMARCCRGPFGARSTGVIACQVVNEMFRSGVESAIAWLHRIRKTLPGRPVLVNDYYGRLGTRRTGTAPADAAP